MTAAPEPTAPALLCWDDSESAAWAIRRTASVLPEPRRAVVVFAHVPADSGPSSFISKGSSGGTPVVSEASAEEVLARGVRTAHDAGFEATGLRIASRGSAAEAITRAAEECNAKLIVLGQRRRSDLGRFLLGSVAREVLRAHPRPVVVVGEGASESPAAPHGPVILCWDGSRGAAEAVRHARTILGPGRRAIVLFAHVPTESARGILAGLSGPDAPVMGSADAEVVIEDGLQAARAAGFDATAALISADRKTAELISEVAEKEDAPMIAMGQRQRSALGTLLLGSVAREVLAGRHRPVLLAGPETPGLYPPPR